MNALQTKRNALLAIGIGGLSAGTIDIAQAFYFFGRRVPYGIAAGLIGRPVPHTPTIYTVGLLLHFFIATYFAAFYFLVSRKLAFLADHWIVCGLAYGNGVEQVMSFVVMPLSALHAAGPYELHDIFLGLGVHMITVGLPIAFSVNRFGK